MAAYDDGMSNAGWYPDPGGAPGMYRYWDGAAWSPTVSPAPGPAPSAPPPPAGPLGGGATPRRRPPASGPFPGRATGAPLGAARAGGRGWLWAAGILVVVAALVFGGLQLVRSLGGTGGALPGRGGGGGTATASPCPPRVPTTAEPTLTADGRVHGGGLSYPEPGAPWQGPQPEDRLTFARAALSQIVVVEPLYDGTSSWVASVLVGELVSGDGNFSSQQGTEMVARCALAMFYSDALVQRSDRVSRAVTLDGHDGWLLEMHLAFDIPKLSEKGETAIFLIVQTGPGMSGIFYASIPDSRPELLAQARQLQAALRVDA